MEAIVSSRGALPLHFHWQTGEFQSSHLEILVKITTSLFWWPCSCYSCRDKCNIWWTQGQSSEDTGWLWRHIRRTAGLQLRKALKWRDYPSPASFSARRSKRWDEFAFPPWSCDVAVSTNRHQRVSKSKQNIPGLVCVFVCHSKPNPRSLSGNLSFPRTYNSWEE